MAEASLRALNALPVRLRDFFARYPPHLYSAKFTGITIPLTRREAKEAALGRASAIEAQSSLSKPNALGQPILVATSSVPASISEDGQTAEIPDLTPPSPTTTLASAAVAPSEAQKFPPNPFLPRKNFVTGRWAGPRIGLRRQADLMKLAKKFGIEELLPPSRKSTAFKQARILQKGLRIKGTGEGQKVKGHIWERHIDATVDKRRKAMEEMPNLIREWQQKGHGRGWKKYPK